MKIIEFLFSLIFATLQFSTTIQKAEAQIFDHLKKSEILCLVKVDDDKKGSMQICQIHQNSLLI